MVGPKRRVLRRGAGGVAGLLLLCLVVGTIYEAVGQRRDQERLPRIGQAVDIGGRTLNISCSGAGSPAVIFDAGAGSPGYSWAGIQPQIARFTRACWYDRAGEGWSEAGPFPRTSAAIARDLHELLVRARVPAPYVLAGHSFGGLTARVYTGLYPTEVAGLVLIEAAHEDEPLRAPPRFIGPKPPRLLWRPLHLLFMAAARVGIIRLMTPKAPLPTDPAQRTRDQIVEALRHRPLFIATTNSSGLLAPDSYAEARAAGGLGDRPLIVLTRGQPFGHDPDPIIERELSTYFQVWVHDLQAQLARLSTRGRQIIVENSGHGIPEEAPSEVAAAIRLVVEAARAPSTRTLPPNDTLLEPHRSPQPE